jgi:hypothetical protein
MRLESDELAVTLLRLFTLLGVFGPHWPKYLVEETLEHAEHQCKERTSTNRLPRAWKFASSILAYHLENRHRLVIADF